MHIDAEHVILIEAEKEVIWIKNVLKNEILNLNIGEWKLFYDNQALDSNSPFENQIIFKLSFNF